MTLNFARRLAYAAGVLAPAAETVRRWSTWREMPPALFDDYIMGALLIYGAYRVGRDARSGQPFLAAGWGFACGLGYASFFSQLYFNRIGHRRSRAAPVEVGGSDQGRGVRRGDHSARGEPARATRRRRAE